MKHIKMFTNQQVYVQGMTYKNSEPISCLIKIAGIKQDVLFLSIAQVYDNDTKTHNEYTVLALFRQIPEFEKIKVIH